MLERGSYVAPSGRVVELTGRLARAVKRTRLYRPEDLAELLRALPDQPGELATRVEVTGETSLAAARRLTDAACLNFASAKHPGGGFLSGAEAQEEALARSSGLYASLRAAPEFYEFHHARRDLLYSDHMIYSPAVPVFRDDDGTLLEDAYDVAFLTSAAPNRGAIQDPVEAGRVGGVLRTRVAKVLALAHAHGHRRLVLGAWGCGVFANDPAEVAGAFATHLLGDGQFAGRFEHVVFAVYDRAPGAPRLEAFRKVFGQVVG